MKPVKILIVGAGQRGYGYAKYAKNNPQKAKVVGVAEPRDFHRERIQNEHNIPEKYVFKDWKQLREYEKFADAVIISTQDRMHKEPVEHFSGKGYNILLEKPMAESAENCKSIVNTVKSNNIIFAVAHVLRYTPYTQKLKKIVKSGRIGDIVSIQRLEPIGYWHFAHSYVRGNWNKESESAPVLLAKSCHDLDWIRYFTESRCNRITSFGGLKHFRSEQKPSLAGDRCMECEIEKECPYSAKKIYLGMYEQGVTEWPVSYITGELSRETIIKALKEGPYGRCVYSLDNDVLDHQVVNMFFENGISSSFILTAFTPLDHRKTRLFGTKGYIEGDGSEIKIYDFLTDSTEVIDTNASESGITGGHGGGDQGLMDAFISAVRNNDRTKILSGPEETLESHLMVFAAEQARKQNKVMEM